MLIGVPKEIKNHEYRVGLTPAAVKEYVDHGHRVWMETLAGSKIGFSDQDYELAGAEIIHDAATIFAAAELIIKVKEPLQHECRMLRAGQTLFTYLHLAADPIITNLLVKSGATCVAYETISDDYNTLPLLSPMSEVAGRLSVQAGAHHLEMINGGNGCLLGGIPGVEPAKVLIIGGGVVGTNAAKMAIGLGADVTIIDRSLRRLRELDDLFLGRLKTVYSTNKALEQYSKAADLVIGAVLIPGAAAPKILNKDHVKNMKPGAVIVDVAIDQGGCFETSKPTTHEAPTYVVDNVVHYCVANMPGAVALSATKALNNATLEYGLSIANKGVKRALLEDRHLLNGLNVHQGIVTCQAVYQSLMDEITIDYLDAKQTLEKF